MSLIQLASVTVIKNNFVSVCIIIGQSWLWVELKHSIIIHPRGDIRMLSYVHRQTVKQKEGSVCITPLYSAGKVEAQKLFSVDSGSSQQHTR